jgi:23S rRNA pseudouridine1911/1915/1917 synthase
LRNGNSNTVHRLSQGLEILHEDTEILVVIKPAGLLSMAAGSQREKTAYWILAEYLRKKGEKRRPAMVHRLDRDTSGVMLFVKSAVTKKKFMDHWDDMVVRRCYTALVEGALPVGEGVIDAPLGEDAGGRVIVTRDGKPAITRWKLRATGVLHKNKSAARQIYSLLELELETGRRNQIRAHLAHIGHPVAGDVKYRARSNPIGRLCLHAETIAFHHPADKTVMEFTSRGPSFVLSPLPPR